MLYPFFLDFSFFISFLFYLTIGLVDWVLNIIDQSNLTQQNLSKANGIEESRMYTQAQNLKANGMYGK